MAARNKKQGPKKPPPAADAFRREVERLIEKGHLKDAVEQAKLCFRQESTPENRRLLERAYFLRAQQLKHDGMASSAVEVSQHLIEFGVTDPALIEEAAQLFVSLGLGTQARSLAARIDSPEARARLALAAVDQSVLHLDRATGLSSDQREGARLIRSALTALEAGDEARAMEDLRGIARSSPFADWKLFARGLAAFHRRDNEETHANWDRLDPSRAAARIARRLLGPKVPVHGQSQAQGQTQPPAPVADLTAIERQVFGEPILAPLKQLREHMAQDRWIEAIRLLGTLRHALRRVDPRLAVRLTRILLDPLRREATQSDYKEAQKLIGSFIRLAEPLPIDPRWNRYWALIWEGPRGSAQEAEDYWTAYLEDLKATAELRPDERNMAQALTWKHLAESYLDEAEALGGPSLFGIPVPLSEDVKFARRRAVECLEAALRLAPKHVPAYEALIDAYHHWEQAEKAVETARRLLEVSPNHLDSLRFLADYYFKRDDAVPALEFASRARALKPLDPVLGMSEWAAQLMQARHHALAGRWEEGRAAFEAAERAYSENRDDYHVLARKAAFEFKAGQNDRAELLIREAQGHVVEPTPLWLALQIEAVRYKLPTEVGARFAVLWKTALKKKCRSETAGAFANLLDIYLSGEVNYPGRAGHIKDVVDYLRRTTRVKYRREDLEAVCSMLVKVPEEKELFEKMARRGLKTFPDSATFLLINASLEMQKGPYHCDLMAVRRQYQKALEIAQASKDPKDAKLLPQIKERLSMLEALTSGPFALPFRTPGAFGQIFEEIFGDYEDDDDDEFDEEDDDMYDTGPPPRARRKR